MGRAHPRIVPVEDVLPQVRFPVRLGLRQRPPSHPWRCREREGEERGLGIPGIAGPPTNLDLLRIRRVPADEVTRGRIDRFTREQAHREVEAAPPCIDRGGPPTVGGAQGREHQRSLCGGREVLGHLRRVVGGVLLVVVERRRPRGLLGLGVEVDGPDKVTDCSQDLPRHGADRSVGSQGDLVHPTIAVLGHRLMVVQVERNDQRAGSVRGGERTRSQPRPLKVNAAC